MQALNQNIQAWLDLHPTFRREFDNWAMVAVEDGDDSYLDDLFAQYKPPFTRKEYYNYIDNCKKKKKHKKCK